MNTKADYTKYVHEFVADSGETRYAVAEYIPANGQYIREFDATEARLTGSSAEFASRPAGVQNFATRRQALRRARHLYNDRETWAAEDAAQDQWIAENPGLVAEALSCAWS